MRPDSTIPYPQRVLDEMGLLKTLPREGAGGKRYLGIEALKLRLAIWRPPRDSKLSLENSANTRFCGWDVREG
jgi:hypothetical protein